MGLEHMGLARIERANPLVVQTLDVVGAFAAAAVRFLSKKAAALVKRDG
jgi:hypothetical protein